MLEKIDGKNVRGVPLADLAPALLGQEGSTVTLGIRRNVVVQNFETQQRCRSVKIIRKSFSPPKELGWVHLSSIWRFLPLPLCLCCCTAELGFLLPRSVIQFKCPKSRVQCRDVREFMCSLRQ